MKYGDCSIAEMTACAPSEYELPAMNSLRYAATRVSDAASVVRNARRPKAWMNFVPHVESSVEQLPNIWSLFADDAQAATASALSCSCDAFSSCTSSALASIAKPRFV